MPEKEMQIVVAGGNKISTNIHWIKLILDENYVTTVYLRYKMNL